MGLLLCSLSFGRSHSYDKTALDLCFCCENDIFWLSFWIFSDSQAIFPAGRPELHNAPISSENKIHLKRHSATDTESKGNHSEAAKKGNGTLYVHRMAKY